MRSNAHPCTCLASIEPSAQRVRVRKSAESLSHVAKAPAEGSSHDCLTTGSSFVELRLTFAAPSAPILCNNRTCHSSGRDLKMCSCAFGRTARVYERCCDNDHHPNSQSSHPSDIGSPHQLLWGDIRQKILLSRRSAMLGRARDPAQRFRLTVGNTVQATNWACCLRARAAAACARRCFKL